MNSSISRLVGARALLRRANLVKNFVRNDHEGGIPGEVNTSVIFHISGINHSFTFYAEYAV